jgi:aldehyde:ferredoxin oxidoreductase
MPLTTVSYDKADVQKGYTHRILEINLGNRSITTRAVPDAMREMFVGGRGYCLKLVYDGTRATTTYDSPENVLALAGGPFCGESGFAGTGKFIVGAISPLTGTFCDSNVGGYFFPKVKQAGFDAIGITGKSDRDVVVFIDGNTNEISIINAPETEFSLFGVESLVDQWKGDGKPTDVALITAGEGARHTRFGCINSVYFDNRRNRCRAKQAGRGGLGTVMRDKGLWGIVVRYDMRRGFSNQPASREGVRAVGKELRGVIREVDPGHFSLGTKGTTALIDLMNPHHILPVNNYQSGQDERAKDVSGTIFAKERFSQNCQDGCFAGCNLACTKACEAYTLKTGPLSGRTVAVDGPEYETAAAVTNLGVFSIDWILEFAWYCDEYGLDTISAGVGMSFLFEAYQRGFLTLADTGGLALNWSDGEAMMTLLHQMAQGAPGIARAAARGLRHLKQWVADRAAARNGRSSEDLLAELSRFAMECKGLEFSMYVTKESLAQQGGYGFALKGPQHDEAWLIWIDQINRELPDFEDKAEALRWFPLFRTWFNIVGLCKLPWIDVRHPSAKHTPEPAKNTPTIEYYLSFVNATLGTEKTLDDLLAESERCYLLHKLINLRQGFGTRAHDRIPLRAMAPVYPNEFASRREYYLRWLEEEARVDTAGKTDQELLQRLQAYRMAQYEKLMDVVYRYKGFDEEAIPTDETLDRLGFTEPGYREIVRAARERGEKSTPAPPRRAARKFPSARYRKACETR